MAEYDTISKHLIQAYPDDFVRFTLQRDDVAACEVINPEQSTVEARQTDSLISVVAPVHSGDLCAAVGSGGQG